jgi:glycosyltransferase involved in cell wall biosynthesis
VNISVFIPTYNYAAFLPQAVESVLAQTLKPCEIIVADDGSTDDTAAVVAKYGDAVRYVRFDHQGVYAVRQAMLSMLKGDWFFNLDADNWIEPDFLEKAAEQVASSRDDTLAFVYPDAVTFGDYERLQPVPEFDVERFKLGNFVDMNSLVKTEAARRFGFDPAFNDGWGDYDFFLTLAKHGYRGVPLRASRLRYRVHAGSITAATKAFDRKQRLMRRIVQKHADFFSEEEGRQAIARFAPEAVMRHRLSELWWAGRRLAALRFALRMLFTHPQAFLSKAVAKAVFGTRSTPLSAKSN